MKLNTKESYILVTNTLCFLLCFRFLLQFFRSRRCSSFTSKQKHGNLCLQWCSCLRQRHVFVPNMLVITCIVAAKRENDFVNYRYHIVKNTWEILPSFAGLANQISCFLSVDDHLYAICRSNTPYRFHISTNQWQCVAKLSAQCQLPQSSFCNKAAVVYKTHVTYFMDKEPNVGKL